MSDMDEEGIPDLEDPLNDDEGMIPPRDHPQAVEEHGITAAEQQAGESLEDRLRREEPEADADTPRRGGLRGRLVEPGSEDVDSVDEEKDSVGSLVEDDDDAQSAEEAAMHITDRP
jgi:hypothetical protein